MSPTAREAARAAVVEKVQAALETENIAGKFIAIKDLKEILKRLTFWKDPLRARIELVKDAINGRWNIEKSGILRRDARFVMENPNKEIDNLLKEVIAQLEELMPK